MRTLLTVLILLHGAIHLMGFLKAFELATINQLPQMISKPKGIIWLLNSLLFFVTAVLILLKREWWPFVGLSAVILSQLLIIIFWEDAKFGTIANIIILFACLIGYGEFQFNHMVRSESLKIFANLKVDQPRYVKENNIGHLPIIVQKWLKKSGVLEHERVISVRLSQKGEMKTSPEGKWMPFAAYQYFNCVEPSFVWNTTVRPLPLVSMTGRDKFINGEGQMSIKLFSLIPVVYEGKNDKINTASMQRFLAEICWFPSAAINDYIKWEEVNENSSKAIFSIDEKTVSGIFEFSNEGKLLSFKTQRYYGGGEDASKEEWVIEMVDHKIFNGVKIPYKCKVTWKLDEGDFNWLNLEITDLKYNKPVLYN